MKISSKGRYSVRVMAELAKHEGQYCSVTILSEKQGITTKYLEKILSILCKSKMIESSRGSNGGYRLCKDAGSYTIAEILQACDDLPKLAPCQEGKNICPRIQECDSVALWDKLNFMITNYLSSITLKDVLNKKI